MNNNFYGENIFFANDEPEFYNVCVFSIRLIG